MPKASYSFGRATYLKNEKNSNLDTTWINETNVILLRIASYAPIPATHLTSKKCIQHFWKCLRALECTMTHMHLRMLVIKQQLTHAAEWRLFDDGQTAIVDGQMADVDAEEYEALKLRQIVMPQFQVVDDYAAFAL